MTPAPQRDPQPAASIPPWRIALFSAALVAYFLWFTWEGIHVAFSPDDMMNLAAHWRMKPWRLFASGFLLWRDFYRPLGGLFYLPIFHMFGLNPVPYHAALVALVLLYVGLVYWLARLLGANALEGWLAAVIVAYHAGVANLYYETSHVYDVLCALSYAAALICYLRARSQGRALRWTEAAAFFVLLLCALNAKEMAVTLPVVLLVYEYLYQRPAKLIAWFRQAGWIAAVSGCLTAIYLYGRVFRGLAHSQGYSAVYSLEQFADFQQRQFQDLFFQWNYQGWVGIAMVWALATYLAWRRDRPLLRFCWAFLVVAPLPVEFLPGRRMAVLAIPLIGWSILAATAALALARAIANSMDHDPGFRRMTAEGRLAIVLAAFLCAWAVWNREFYVRDVHPAMANLGHPTAAVIRQFQMLAPVVRPRSTIVFLNDPFDGWDMAFIAELWFNDRTLTIRLQKKTPLGPGELARAGYLFDWREEKLALTGGAATVSESERR